MCKSLWISWLIYSNVITTEIGISKQSIASSLQEGSMLVNQLHVPLLIIKGAIGPATCDYLVREINNANRLNNIPLIIITLDTLGGLSANLIGMLNADIQTILDVRTDSWGIKVSNVEIKHVDLNESMISGLVKSFKATTKK